MNTNKQLNKGNKMRKIAMVIGILSVLSTGANAGYCRRPFDNFYDLESEKKLKDEFLQLKKQNDLSGINFLDCI